MREDDLVDMFARLVDHAEADGIDADWVKDARQVLQDGRALLESVDACERVGNTLGVWDAREELGGVLSELFDLADDIAPEGTIFSAHPGDGADYGYWPVDDDENGEG